MSCSFATYPLLKFGHNVGDENLNEQTLSIPWIHSLLCTFPHPQMHKCERHALNIIYSILLHV